MDDMAGSGALAGAPVCSGAPEDSSMVLVSTHVTAQLAKRLAALSVTGGENPISPDYVLGLVIDAGVAYWEQAEREGADEAQTLPTP